jgi:hypothetical protein
MSLYCIYQIDHFDPKNIGRKIRKQVLLYAILAPVLVLSFAFCLMILKIGMGLLFSVFLPVLVIYYLYGFYKLGLKNRQLKVIGKIEFTKTGIKKIIGDFTTEYDFKSIEKIELTKHLPLVGISSSLSDNFTYILRIIFSNFSTESIVVSNLPEDKKLNINIVQTLKTLKHFIKTEISIET